MKAVCINPFARTVAVVDGDVDALLETRIDRPYGMIELDPLVGLVCSPLGTIGPAACLFWHAGLREFFGGMAYVIGLDEQGHSQSIPEGWWLRTQRQVEFVGRSGDSLPRLRELIEADLTTGPVRVPGMVRQ